MMVKEKMKLQAMRYKMTEHEWKIMRLKQVLDALKDNKSSYKEQLMIQKGRIQNEFEKIKNHEDKLDRFKQEMAVNE